MDQFPPSLAFVHTTEQQKKRQDDLRQYRAVVVKQIENAKETLEFGKYSCIIRLGMEKSFRYELIRELQQSLFPGIEVEVMMHTGRGEFDDEWTAFPGVGIEDSTFERIRITFRA